MILRVQRAPRLLIDSLHSTNALPDFLVPACATQTGFSKRGFSSTSPCKSRVGNLPVSIPPEVKLHVHPPAPRKVNDNLRLEALRNLEVEGPLGKISVDIPPYMRIHYDELTRKVKIGVEDPKERRQRAMWGTMRAHIANHVTGVSEGHTATLQMIGVGYRATLEPSAVSVRKEYGGQQFVNLKVGFTHPVELGVPKGMKASIPQPTKILLEGTVKEVVNEFAAKIRQWRRPEPYKGKGIFVNGETIKLKPKRIK